MVERRVTNRRLVALALTLAIALSACAVANAPFAALDAAQDAAQHAFQAASPDSQATEVDNHWKNPAYVGQPTANEDAHYARQVGDEQVSQTLVDGHDPTQFQVVGVRLGMSASEAVEALRAHFNRKIQICKPTDVSRLCTYQITDYDPWILHESTFDPDVVLWLADGEQLIRSLSMNTDAYGLKVDMCDNIQPDATKWHDADDVAAFASIANLQRSQSKAVVCRVELSMRQASDAEVADFTAKVSQLYGKPDFIDTPPNHYYEEWQWCLVTCRYGLPSLRYYPDGASLGTRFEVPSWLSSIHAIVLDIGSEYRLQAENESDEIQSKIVREKAPL
jgi:hypothetical protein